MNTFKYFAIIFTFIFIHGCATLPSPEQMRAETRDYKLPKYPEQGNAIVYIVRPSSLGGIVKFNVFLDDQNPNSEMGFNRGSQYIYFSVKPGEHTIESKAENWSQWKINVKAGDILYIQQEASMGIIMARNTIFKIDEEQGKYHVKTLQLGTILKSEK